MAEILDPKERARNKQHLVDRAAPLIDLIRKRLHLLHDTWLKAHHAWQGVQTYSFYESEFRHFIPAFRRQIERHASRLVQQLMPHHEFFNAFPGDERDAAADDHGAAVNRYMSWLLNDHIKIRRVVEQVVRTRLLYGRGITKNTVREILVPDVQYGKFQGPVAQRWPYSHAVDPFNFYVWPETSTGLDDAMIVFEDVLMPWTDYQDAVNRKIAEPIKREDLQRPKFQQHLQLRFDVSGMFTPEELVEGGPRVGEGRAIEQQAFVELSEVYLRGLSGAWMHLWFVWNVTEGPRLTRVHKASYPRAPYRLTATRELPSQHYSPGIGQDLEALQILLNDQFNQGEESRATSAGPPVLIDPSKVKKADSFVFGYRRKWFGEIDGVKMLDVPDTSPNSLKAAMFTLQYMEGQLGPLGQGQVPRGLPRGSSAVGNLISLASADIVGDARAIEEDCLTPTLQDLYHLTLAFVPESQIIHIPGAEGFAPRTLTVNDLYGGWHLKWAGANRMQDLGSQAQQALVLAANVLKSADVLRLQGWDVDFGMLFRVIWKDLLGERRLSNVIRRLSPEERGAELAIQTIMQGRAGGPGQTGPAPSGARATTSRPQREAQGGSS